MRSLKKKGGKTMSEMQKQIENRVANNADLAGAQELIDSHIDAVNGGLYVVQHINFYKVVECCIYY
jgi:hypothetical protein